MPAGVNKVILLGNLGSDPDLRQTNNGNSVCEFRLATNEAWTGKDGKKQERTEWHRIIVWGKHGEVCAKYLSKGRLAFVEGKLTTRQWEDKEGNKRYTTEVVASNVQFLGGGAGSNDDSKRTPSDFGGGGNPDDDIPF